MRAIIFILMLGFVASNANAEIKTNQYSKTIRTYCKLKQGQWAHYRGMHECAQLVERILKLTGTVLEHRFTHKDSTTNHLLNTIEAGDVIFLNNYSDKNYDDFLGNGKQRSICHYIVILDRLDNGRFICAEQNVQGHRGILISQAEHIDKITKGEAQVFKLVSGNYTGHKHLRNVR